MFLSIFDMFKIGIGPSSSHTMGPMVAALRFLAELQAASIPAESLSVSLHGSLAHTGIGHGTGRAIVLGLAGHEPHRVDPDAMEAIVAAVEAEGRIAPPGHPAYRFDPRADIVFDKAERLPGHSNGMRFSARDEAGNVVLSRVYYSIGGGFVLDDRELDDADRPALSNMSVPYPFANAAEMLEMAARSRLSIASMMRANEEVFRSPADIDAGIDDIWVAMSACIDRGMSRDGLLPGGFNVKRRAHGLREALERQQEAGEQVSETDWLSVYAIAVNEENASGSRVVTAPTNGAAGIIPAVLRHKVGAGREGRTDKVHDYLLTAAAIGAIIKRNASISGAEVGCQGEVGSASAMAAAALCAINGGTPEQVENAAEIALEHHLGMTCDPVGGLVQIPCIERNAFGAIKAVAASSLALKGDGSHAVSLDTCIETMRQTGHDMSDRYKETSLAGLAKNVVIC